LNPDWNFNQLVVVLRLVMELVVVVVVELVRNRILVER
jgi:hypothetical protein